MPTKLVPYTDASGERQWAEVSSELARALDSFDRNMRRRDALFRKNHRLKTGEPARRGARRNGKKLPRIVGFLNVELEPAFRALFPRAGAGAWEGPKMSFSHLIGEGATWPPEGAFIDPGTPDDPGSQGVWRWDGEFLVCALCGGRELGRHQCCLGCCRTGRDGEL